MINNKLCNFDLNIMEWVDLEIVKLGGLLEKIATKEQMKSIEYEV